MALARRDLSGKPAHATSEVSTAACSRPHSSHAHTTLCRDGLWLLTGDVCNGTCRRRRLDDAVCSRDVEEVVAAGLQTCSANVCMTHVRTAARSHTHHANAGLTTGRAAFAETPAKGHSCFCDLFHAAQASCKQRQLSADGCGRSSDRQSRRAHCTYSSDLCRRDGKSAGHKFACGVFIFQ